MKQNPNHPESIVAYLDRHLQKIIAHRTRAAIAEAIGIPPNLLSMILAGKAKLPLVRVQQFAEQFEADPKELFMLTMREYQPELLDVINRLYTPPSACGMSETDQELILVIKSLQLDTTEVRATVAALRAYAKEVSVS
jgi:hypothetical protein